MLMHQYFRAVLYLEVGDRSNAWLDYCGCPMSGGSAAPTFTPGGCPACSSSLSDISLSLLVSIGLCTKSFLFISTAIHEDFL